MALLLPACCRELYFLTGVFLPLEEELKSVRKYTSRHFWCLFCVRTAAASELPPQWQAQGLWDLSPRCLQGASAGFLSPLSSSGWEAGCPQNLAPPEQRIREMPRNTKSRGTPSPQECSVRI